MCIRDRRDEWPNPRKLKTDLVAELEERVEAVPGNRYEFLQPIQMRFNEMLSGVRSELAIKIFGDDLAQLNAIAESIEGAIASVSGIQGLQVEQVSGLSVLTLEPKFLRLAQYGMRLESLQKQVSVAMGGEVAGTFYEGDRSFDITVRLPEEIRTDLNRLQMLPVLLPDGSYVSLDQLVDIKLVDGVNQVNRENGKRRIVISANVRDRDLGSFVSDIKERVKNNVALPPGYWVEYGGTYKNLQSANQRLQLVVPITLIIIFALLFFALRSIKDSLIIFSGVPLALTGGVFFLLMRDIPFSISAGVGFIALSGIAILNGLVMVSFIRDLEHSGMPMRDAIYEGAMTRLRPVLTTALVASLGFVPMALNTGIGSEVQRPLATVVIGGVFSSTLLTLFVLPALYALLHKKRARD